MLLLADSVMIIPAGLKFPKTHFILRITQLIFTQPKGNARVDPVLSPSIAALFSELSLPLTPPT